VGVTKTNSVQVTGGWNVHLSNFSPLVVSKTSHLLKMSLLVSINYVRSVVYMCYVTCI
jgi:hypothetical protein